MHFHVGSLDTHYPPQKISHFVHHFVGLKECLLETRDLKQVSLITPAEDLQLSV